MVKMRPKILVITEQKSARTEVIVVPTVSWHYINFSTIVFLNQTKQLVLFFIPIFCSLFGSNAVCNCI